MDFDFLNKVEVQNNSIRICANSILEAFLKTYRLYNRVDFNEIKSITPCSDEQILEELKEILVFNPVTQEYEVVFDYLSKDKIKSYQESKEYHCNEEMMDLVMNSISKLSEKQIVAMSEISDLAFLMNPKEIYQAIRSKLGYIPYDYSLENFFSGKRREYQRDYFMMLTNNHTVEVISNAIDRIQVMNEYSQLLLENNIVNEVTIVSSTRFKTADPRIQIISSSKYLKEEYENVIIHDIEGFKNKKAVMNKLEKSKYSVLFIPAISEDFWFIGSYLNQNYVNTHAWINDGLSMAHNIEFGNKVIFELPVLFHNQLLIHMEHIQYEIIRTLVPDRKEAMKLAKRINHSGLEHINLSCSQKNLLRNDISILGTTHKSILKNSKFHTLAIHVATDYLENPSSRQIIYIDLDHSFENLDYRSVMKNLLIQLAIPESEIVITDSNKFNQEAKVFISKSRELVPDSIQGLTAIHHLDIPDIVTMYIRNADVKQYLYLGDIDLDEIEIDRRCIYEQYYSALKNDDYNYQQLSAILKSFHFSADESVAQQKLIIDLMEYIGR